MIENNMNNENEKSEIIIPVVYCDGDIFLYKVAATKEQIEMIRKSKMSFRCYGKDEDFEAIFGKDIDEVGELIYSPGTINRD